MLDASVVVKWCLGSGEPRTENAQVLLDAHLVGSIRAAILDLTLYEVGNALVAKGFAGSDLAVLLDLLEIWDLEWLGVAGPETSARTADLVDAHRLSFYDASYLAVALGTGLPLVTDDGSLLDAAHAEGVGIALQDIV